MRINRRKLELAMANQGLNLMRLAEKAGISRATLSYANNGKDCKPPFIANLAHALNVTPEYLAEE